MVEDSRWAFMTGPHASALVTGVLRLLGAVLAAAGMRRGAAPEAG
ncbi:hypothetical protein [Streptomyces sp. NPDC007905]